MSYLENKLTADEELIYTAKLHWIMLIKPIVALILLSVAIANIEKYRLFHYVPIAMPYKNYIYLTVIIVFVGWPLLNMLILKWSTHIGITNQRLLCKRGFIAIDLNGMPLSKIENIDSSQSILGRILGYGTVTVKGSGSTPIYLHDIAKPMVFRNELASRLTD